MDIKIENLKPCPLCNSTEKLLVYTEYMPVSKINLGVVECTNDPCPMIIRAENIQKAVEKWNKRPREDFLVEQNQALAQQLIIDEEIENSLSFKLNEALLALEMISQLWHGRGLSPQVLIELDKTIKEIKGETKSDEFIQ